MAHGPSRTPGADFFVSYKKRVRVAIPAHVYAYGQQALEELMPGALVFRLGAAFSFVFSHMCVYFFHPLVDG